MKAIVRVEPVIWFLFGLGFFAGALVMPAWILVVTLAGPLGMAPDGALAFERVHGLAASGVGRVFLFGVISVLLWHAANHLRHFNLDFAGRARDRWLAPLLYGGALVLTVVALVAVVRL